MAKPIVLLQHGWGFSRQIWNDWVEELELEYEVLTTNRGYFSNSDSDIDINQKMKADFAIVHSFGLHLLPMNLFSRLKKLVIISGFQEFHPPSGNERAISEKVVLRMLQVLDKQPAEVLREFYRNCFYPVAKDVVVPQNLNKSTLFDDLALLNKFSMNLKLLKPIPKVLMLHGKNDKIVPPSLGELLHNKLPQSSFHACENGGHMILSTHQDWCMGYISEFFES